MHLRSRKLSKPFSNRNPRPNPVQTSDQLLHGMQKSTKVTFLNIPVRAPPIWTTPRLPARNSNHRSKGASRVQTPRGQRRSARHKKRPAIVVENDWLAVEEMLTAHIVAATKAAKDRRANFYNRSRSESPVRKLSHHIVWLKLTPASSTDASHLLL